MRPSPTVDRGSLALAGLLVVGACGETIAVGGSDDDVDTGDQDPPTIVVTQVEDGQPSYQPVTVTATVTDDSSVSSVKLYYHNVSSVQDTAVVMEPPDAADPSTYSASIPGDDVSASKVYYYVQACDDARPANCGTSPEDGDYFSFNVD